MPLRRDGRLMGLDLPIRDRLVCRMLETEGQQWLLILGLGSLRQVRERNDGSTASPRMMRRDDVPLELQSHQAELDTG